MDSFKYITKKINSAELLTDPYEHIWIEDFLSQEHYDQLKNDFEQSNFKKEDDDHNQTSEMSWQDFNEFINSKCLYHAIRNKLTATREYEDIDKFLVNYMLDDTKDQIGLHSDHKGKQTIQWHIYMPDQDYDKFGTILCLDKQRTGKKEFPLKHNCFLAYGKNIDGDLHYMEAGDRIRKSLLVRYR